MTALPALDGAATWWSRPATPNEPIVVLLHGAGSDESDLAWLAAHLPEALVAVGLRAPYPCPTGGWQWYDPDDLRLDAGPWHGDALGIDHSAGLVEEWAADQRVEGRTVAGVVGFSQGGFLAVQLLRRAAERWPWAAALSGGPFPADDPGDARLAAGRPPLFWGRGGQEEMSGEFAPLIRAWFEAHTQLTEICSPELGHAVDELEAAALGRWIADRQRDLVRVTA